MRLRRRGARVAAVPRNPPLGFHRLHRAAASAGPARARRTHKAARAASAEEVAAARRLLRQRAARLVLVLVAASVLSPWLNGASPTRAYAVASGSMEPTIPTGALVLAAPEPVDVGDVVVYWSPVGAYQIHRVHAVEERDGKTYYFTRGDANGATDSFAVPERDVRGVVQRHVPYVGYLWLLPAHVQAAAFGALLGLYLLVMAWDARALLGRKRRALGGTAGLLALVLLLPAVGAAVLPTYAESTLTADVATTPLPMAAGTMASAAIASDQNSATVTAAAPKLWKEITMYNCQRDGTCVQTVNSNGYGEQIGSWARINTADYAPAPTFYFEAYMKAGSGGTTYAILRDKSGAADIAASEVSTTSTSLTLVRSADFTLSGDKDYTIRTKKATANGELYHARLVVVQQFPTKTVEQVRLAQGVDNTGTGWSVPTRATKWRYDGASTDGVTAGYFEIVAEVDGNMLTDSFVRLMDRTSGLDVTRITISILDTSPTRFRSGDIKSSLVDGHEYEIEVQRGEGLLTDKLKMYVARVLVLQSSFTKTVRYVDLSWSASTTSTSFVATGYPGRYHMDTEWGSITGYFEATMRNSNSGSTSSARLWDQQAGAAVSGSQVDVTGTTRTRARSGLITLNLANVTYEAQLQASANSAEIRSAWLIVLQGPGKTYDHALKTKNDVVDACTWSFTLQHTSSSDLARIAHATLSLRGGGALQDQVKVVSGSVTQSVGTAVSVAFPNAVEHVVQTNPTSTGSSTLNADLLGTCTGFGIRTSQPVTYTLA